MNFGGAVLPLITDAPRSQNPTRKLQVIANFRNGVLEMNID